MDGRQAHRHREDGDVQYTFKWEIAVSNLPENTALNVERQGLRAGYIKSVAEESDLPSEEADSA